MQSFDDGLMALDHMFELLCLSNGVLVIDVQLNVALSGFGSFWGERLIDLVCLLEVSEKVLVE